MKKRKNILLVEPNYESLFPPLGLMKISTWHKRKGDRVDFTKGNIIRRKKYDTIYVTTLFTYFAKEVIETVNVYKEFYPKAKIKIGGICATLLPNYIKKYTGIAPHVGLFYSAENCPPDYSLFPNMKYSLTFTTRGCFRNCPYCAVKKHEPEFFTKEHWERDIEQDKKSIIFWDNNWFKSPNFLKDIEKLKNINKSFDFNQGLDATLFTEDKAQLLCALKIEPLRFAFDSLKNDGCVQRAINLAKKYGKKDIRVYVLYNFRDTPEDFYYRIDEINRLGALSYPMRYRPIDKTENHYISENWDKRLLRALKLILMYYYSKGMIRQNREAFKKIFSHSPRTFRTKLYEIYEEDRKRHKGPDKMGVEINNVNWAELETVQV